MIGEALAADLLGAAAFTHRVDQLDPIRVDAPEYGRGSQEGPRPVLVSSEEAKSRVRSRWKQGPIVTRQPAVKRPVAHAFGRGAAW